MIEHIRKIITEGNVRKIVIKDKNRAIIAEFPLTFGIVGIALAPILAVIGAIAALVADCSITVVKK